MVCSINGSHIYTYATLGCVWVHCESSTSTINKIERPYKLKTKKAHKRNENNNNTNNNNITINDNELKSFSIQTSIHTFTTEWITLYLYVLVNMWCVCVPVTNDQHLNFQINTLHIFVELWLLIMFAGVLWLPNY